MSGGLTGHAQSIPQGRDAGYGFCPLHRLTYKGAGCPRCAAEAGGSGAGSGISPGNQAALDAASMLGTAIGQWLRGDPQRAAQVEAEARARAFALQQERIRREAEEARNRKQSYARLKGMLKLDSFDGDQGGLVLKGVNDGARTPALMRSEPDNELGLKFGDDGLKPRGTQAAANTGPAEPLPPNTDPMVVDLRNLKKSAFLVRSFETAPPEDAPLLLDEALRAADGDPTLVDLLPADSQGPTIDGRGLLTFQQANNDYRQANDYALHCSEIFRLAQERRVLADRIGEAARLELEQARTGLMLQTDLDAKQRQLVEIFAATRELDEAYAAARAEVEAAELRRYRSREEAVRVLRAVSSGRDPGAFHPPVASLPGLDADSWLQVQEKMIAEQQALDRQVERMRASLEKMAIPVPAAYERMHEGVILGALTDSTDAASLYAVRSPFSDKTPDEMNVLAERAKQEGIPGVGGAMVVSFGTPLDGSTRMNVVEAIRVGGDHLTEGEVSLGTPEGRAAVANLTGKHFDRLVAHSNGASVTEALIRQDLIKVDELNIVGGDRALLNGHAFQQMIDSGKVKRVVVWINVNDPVVWTTVPDQLKLPARSADALEHIARKLTGELAGGDTQVSYRFMLGHGSILHGNETKSGVDIFAHHNLVTGYYPDISRALSHPGESLDFH